MNNVVVAGPWLRVVFNHLGDRWGHQVEIIRGGEWHAALESVEGAACDGWPPSPAFQSLDVDTFGGTGRTVLLVGKAGVSHWSAAIAVEPTAGALKFDVACRLSARPSFLGSSYRIVGGRLGDLYPAIRFAEVKLGGDNDSGRWQVESTDDRLAIRLALPPSIVPTTVRWQYTIGSRKETTAN